MRIAIYDLDRTITRRPTFTPFLIFAAMRDAPWRLSLLPVWLFALIGYKLGLYPREPLKQFGIWLFIGGRFSKQRGDALAAAFIARLEHGGWLADALRQIAEDRAAGYRLLMATAAPQFYAEAIATHLGFDACLATRHLRHADGDWLARIDGGNHYGAAKLVRVNAWLEAQHLARADCNIRVYSDSPSDAPLLDWADKPVLINHPGTVKAQWERASWR